MYREKKFIVYNGKIIRYIIDYSVSIKNIYIKLDKDLNILVKVNPNVQHSIIEHFLLDNIEKLTLLIEKKKNSSLYNVSKNKISLFGKEYNIFIEKSFKNETYRIYNSKVFLFLNDKNEWEKVIRRLLKKTAEEYIIPRAIELSKKINVNIDSISIKWLTRTWGICNSAKKAISFSSRLVVFDKTTIDYVIVHEICHLIEPNHSKNFWNLVEKFCPNFKEFKNRLKDF